MNCQKKYYDRNGKEIKDGMTIKNVTGEVEKVYSCGDGDLGLSASNEDYLKVHPEAEIEFYPLSEFDTTNDWEIV